jgi:hypothetical protein
LINEDVVYQKRTDLLSWLRAVTHDHARWLFFPRGELLRPSDFNLAREAFELADKISDALMTGYASAKIRGESKAMLDASRDPDRRGLVREAVKRALFACDAYAAFAAPDSDPAELDKIWRAALRAVGITDVDAFAEGIRKRDQKVK